MNANKFESGTTADDVSDIGVHSRSVDESNPEKKIEEFTSFLPALAYNGSSMKQIDAAGILDMAMSWTTPTLRARRWESALLVNLDNRINSDRQFRCAVLPVGYAER